MASALAIANDFEPLPRPVRVAADETWIAPAKLDHARATERIRDLVLPHLTHRDDRDDLVARISPTLLYVPFWRVKLAVPAAHLSAAAVRPIAIGNIEFPMPARCYGGRAGVLMICARSGIPFTPSLPSFFGGLADSLEVHRTDLLLSTNDRAQSLLFEGERIDPDVDRTSGERLAAATLVDLLQRPGTTRYVFNPRVESTLFVHYPLYHARFGPDAEHFVFLSARDGEVVSARYPRRPSMSERVKRLFTR